jgi:hypothetical protein
MIPAPPKLIVIDTNVCLDLFVFHDPRWAPCWPRSNPAQCAPSRAPIAATNTWIVLHYPHLPLDDEQPGTRRARFDALIEVVAPDSARCACRSAPTATTRNSWRSRAMPAPPS